MDYNDIYANRVRADGWVVTGVRNTPALSALQMSPNVPNPFSTTSSFDLTLDADSDVTMELFDVAGRRVRHVALGRIAAGTTAVNLDGRDHADRLLPSGVYFVRVRTNAGDVARKLVIAR